MMQVYKDICIQLMQQREVILITLILQKAFVSSQQWNLKAASDFTCRLHCNVFLGSSHCNICLLVRACNQPRPYLQVLCHWNDQDAQLHRRFLHAQYEYILATVVLDQLVKEQSLIDFVIQKPQFEGLPSTVGRTYDPDLMLPEAQSLIQSAGGEPQLGYLGVSLAIALSCNLASVLVLGKNG